MFQQVVWSAVEKEHLDLSRLHADTTSQSVYGAYTQEGGLNVTYGYSKDLRPDLKQILYGLVVNREGVPAFGKVLDGNQKDRCRLDQPAAAHQGPRGGCHPGLYLVDDGHRL